MEIPDVGVREGIMAGLIGLATYFWKKLNGALSREEFQKWVEEHEKRLETQRVEFRDTLINIFKEIQNHTKNDSDNFGKIERSLGRLEERAELRRATDA